MGESDGFSLHSEAGGGQAKESGQSSPAAKERSLLHHALREGFSLQPGRCRLTLMVLGQSQQAPKGCI